MKYVGAHVSAQGGVFNAPVFASEINARAFAFFTKNQRQWASKPYTPEDILLFKKNVKELGFDGKYLLPHSSYLINLGNPDIEKRKKSLDAFIDEVSRAGELGAAFINFHPGSSLNEISEDKCLELIADSINEAIEKTKQFNVTMVIENTAGQGSNVGYKFEHLKKIIDNVENKKRVGVCIDTCHTFTSGYDISDSEKFRKVIDEFENIVGLKYLKAMHLNDSMKGLGSKVDRHASLGSGTLGLAPFEFIMNNKAFEDMPLILETPDPSLWEKEIKLLYSFQKK